MKTKLTSSRVASHANPTLWQESDWEKTTIDTYGLKCLEQFEKLNRGGLWARTFSELLIGTGDWYSTRCRLIWKVKGTKYNRIYFQLFPLAHLTEETEFGLWLLKTPTKFDGEVTSGKKNPKSGDSGTLAQEIMSNYPPTMEKLGMLPTPNAFDCKSGVKKETYENRKKRHLKKGVNLQYPLKQMAADLSPISGKTSQLSPQFVAEMMGFPKDWTELPFLNGEQNQSKVTETQ